jgi:hypothetical protein
MLRNICKKLNVNDAKMHKNDLQLVKLSCSPGTTGFNLFSIFSTHLPPEF